MNNKQIEQYINEVNTRFKTNIKFQEGDLIELAKAGEFNVIAHGCNCFNTMGAGIAKFIAAEFPEAYAADQDTNKGDQLKLGTFTSALSENYEVLVYNLYTQYVYGDGPLIAIYLAIRASLEAMRDDLEFYDLSKIKIGLPLIGCGLGKVDIDKVLDIVGDIFWGSNYNITIVCLSEKK